MKFKEVIEELYDTQGYKKFQKENSKAFLSAGFFILDLVEKSEKIQIDFFLPDEKRIVGFEFPFKEPKIFEDEIKKMEELSTDILIDIDDLQNECLKIMKKHDSGMVPTKIIAILKDNKWNLTCMDNALGIIRIHVDAKTGKEISFDKGSLMDFMGIKKGK